MKNHTVIGEKILADVFDALTRIRPYKKAWSHEKAFDLIAEERGTQFNRYLRIFFFNKSEHVTKICEELKDNPAVARSIP